MKKGILIYNHLSGDHSIPGKLDYIIGRFQDSGILLQPYRLVVEEQSKLIDVLHREQYDFVIASGGDGTINLTVNMLLKNDIPLPLGIIPAGTCNDFARSLGIPYSVQECIDIILQGRTIDVDVGVVNENQYFLNTCAGGAFVDVSFNTHNELKKNFGPFAYYLKALSELTHIKSFKLKFTTDTQTVEEKAILFLILNGKDAGGFSNIIKEADYSDGLMDILIIKNCSHIDLASLFFKVLSNDFRNDRHVTKLRAKSCTIEGSSEIVLSVDGEEGGGLPVSIRFINRAIKVFVK